MSNTDTSDFRIPQLSSQARIAFKQELAKPAYKQLDKETAIYEAAKALIKQEDDQEIILFDRSNPADQIILTVLREPAQS